MGQLSAARKRKSISLPRGLVPGIYRADAAPTMADIAARITAIGTTFEAFKQKHTEQIAELKAGRDDVVRREHVDRINSDVGRLTSELGELAQRVAAARVAPGNDNAVSPEAIAYSHAFNAFVRKGIDAGLSDLAIKAAMSTDSNPDGGYVVPETLEQTILRVETTRNAMRRLATVQSVSTAVYKRVHNLAGATSGWVGERGARSQTNTPALTELSFPTHEIYAMPAATQGLIDDAYVNIESWLGEEIGIKFAEEEGDAFVDGDGINKPRGFLSYETAASTVASPSAWGKIGFTKTGANGDFAANPNGADALIDLIYSLKPGYRANGVWTMNDASFAKTRKLKDGDDNYIWERSLQVGEPNSLLGYPVETDDSMPDFATNVFPIAFGDFKRGYIIVDRMGSRMLRDPYSSKPYVLFYTTKRVGGGVQDFHAIKLLKAAA